MGAQFRIRLSLITPFRDPKMNVFGYKTVCRSSINRPEKGDFSVFHFRISFSGRLPPENGDPLSDKVSYPNMASGLGFPNVMGGNKRVTSQHSSSCKYLSAEGAKRILKGTVLLLMCPVTHWHTPRASPRAGGVGRTAMLMTTRAVSLS